MDIFSALNIGNRQVKNRTVMAPMVINYAAEDGSVTPVFRHFYQARAKGGVGYIVVGGVYVHPDGRGFNRQLGIYHDNLIPGLTRLAETIKADALAGIQLSVKSIGRSPEVFSLKEIGVYRRAFAEGAVRATKCGFDAVELHACHDYWLNCFLSPFFNKRTDEYGGGLENRFRLLKEVVEEIRLAVGQELLLGIRLSLDDFMEDGLGLYETVEVGRRLEALGVDYISASVGIGLTQFRMSPPMEVPRSTELPLARTLQQSVSIPVIGVGRLDRPAEFQAAVEDGHVQLAGVGRALIADPEFVNKISEGRLSEIRPCIACNHCLACLHWGEPVKCVVNPYVGRDLLKPAITTVPRKVVVVGGGPAGLTAAATAAKCGVRVVLIEKSFRLGGTLHIAKRPPFKEPIADFIAYLVAEAQKVGVEILLGQSINESLLKGLAPDEIIWAAGAEAVSPDLACLDEQCVLMAEGVLSCDKIKPGQYLVLGGGMVGLETAEYLCARGGIVTVMEMLDELGRGLGPMRQKLILDRLIRAGVNLFTRAKVISIENRMVEVELPCGNVVYGPFDAVVLASGYRPNQSRVQTLEDIAPVHIIGDARQVRSILEAVSEGMETALGLGQTAS